MRGLVSADDESRLRDLRESAQTPGGLGRSAPGTRPRRIMRSATASRPCSGLPRFRPADRMPPKRISIPGSAIYCGTIRSARSPAFSAVHVGAAKAPALRRLCRDHGRPRRREQLGCGFAPPGPLQRSHRRFRTRLAPRSRRAGLRIQRRSRQVSRRRLARWLRRLCARLCASQPNDAQIKALLIASLDHAGKADEASALRAQAPAPPSAAAAQDAGQGSYAAAPRYRQTRSDVVGALGANSHRIQHGAAR